MSKSVKGLSECAATETIRILRDRVAELEQSGWQAQQEIATLKSLSIQQEADAKDAARWRESTKGKPLLVECRNRSGKPITVSIGCREECVDWPEKYTDAINTAMATPTDSEDK